MNEEKRKSFECAFSFFARELKSKKLKWEFDAVVVVVVCASSFTWRHLLELSRAHKLLLRVRNKHTQRKTQTHEKRPESRVVVVVVVYS